MSVTMATIKGLILDDFAYFGVFSGSQTRDLGLEVPNKGHVMNHNDSLVNPYMRGEWIVTSLVFLA